VIAVTQREDIPFTNGKGARNLTEGKHMRNILMIDKGKVMEGKSSISWKCAMLNNVALCVCVCVCVPSVSYLQFGPYY